MIIPASPEELSGMTEEQIIEAYKAIGFDEEEARAYTAQLLPAAVTKTVLPLAHFMTIESAAELAKSVGHRPLAREVEASMQAGVGFIKVAMTEGGVSVGSPKGVAVMFMLDKETPQLQKSATERDPHVTLAHLGPAADLSLRQTRKVIALAAEVAARHPNLRGVVKGTGYFADSGAWYGQVHVPGLDDMRADLVDTLKAAELPVDETYDFTPHVTLAYSETEPDDELEPFEVSLSKLTTAVGSFRYDAKMADEQAEPEGIEGVVTKSDERRFTLAPMYLPGQYDSQGDWATTDDLQQAVWKFARGDRLIARQHRPQDGPVGEVVEMMVTPWEMTVPIMKADGTSRDVTFPAGTPWLGVVWEPDVWDEIKAGKMRGYSIGGRANLLNVRIGDEE